MACKSLTWTAFDGRLVADLVGLAVVDAALHAAAGQPGGEAVRVVVAARLVAGLGDRQPAELAPPDHQRLVEQPALLQVGQQAGDRPVGLAGELAVVPLDVDVAVPGDAGSPCRRSRSARTARRARPAAGRSGTGGRSGRTADRPARTAAGRAFGSDFRSSASGAADCIRYASSKLSIRAVSSASAAWCSPVQLVELAAGGRAAAAARRRSRRAGRTEVVDRPRRSAAGTCPGRRPAEKPAVQLAAWPLGSPRPFGSDMTTNPGRFSLSLPRP